MDLALIPELMCPYCGGALRLARENQRSSTKLIYGLLECRCFVFPVVHGILLLNLAKGYGGPEEAIQPYVPLQVAAIRYLQANDVAGLESWMRRHMPLGAQILAGTTDYLTLSARRFRSVDAAINQGLWADSRYEVLGYERGLNRRLRHLVRGPAVLVKTYLSTPWSDYYLARFFAPRVNALALQLSVLPMNGRILSLCCGHGVFENLARADGRATTMVSMDGQFLNLLITQRYAYPQGNYICHDLQFPLPFRNDTFDGVFSSTCLPEMPTQRSFVSEGIRVTTPSGWTMFDSVWNETLPGVKRIDRYRNYRYCQNFFTKLEEYIPFFTECANGREVGVDIPGIPARYVSQPTWIFGDRVTSAIVERQDPQMSVLVRDPRRFVGFTSPHRPWLRPERLSISPVFDWSRTATGVFRLRRRGAFARLAANFAPAEFAGYPGEFVLNRELDAAEATRLFCQCILVVLPPQVGAVQRRAPTRSGAALLASSHQAERA
jgi:hypothetical protein